MTSNHDKLEPPLDARRVATWAIYADGYGRAFRGSSHGAAHIYGHQHADGRVDRSIHLDTRQWDNPLSAQLAANDVLAAVAEVEALQ